MIVIDHNLGGEDPAAILGVPAQADAEALRAAYTEKIRQFPPDRCPDEFERVRDAYSILSDPRQRAQILMHQDDPLAPISDLLSSEKMNERRFIGMDAWLAAIRRMTDGKTGVRP
jgi:curved DNA-binding protein CbpA